MASNYTHTHKKVTLHGFSDASEAAYACVVYAVQRNRETTKVVMLCGRKKQSRSSQAHMYSKTRENPADHGSRGMSPKYLPDCSLWWEGPQWLSTEEAWSKQPTIKDKKGH
ncbi:DUF1758 domain-containing protein [Trichonephila clavipes]|nr:DUF1758 domain-containing protein [Trichonephila clavipes]